jgi:hypothetical protein
MKPPADGWDADEQETLAPFQQELEAIRTRHAQFSEHDQARLLRRIQKEAGQTPARGSIFWTQPWLIAAASVVIVVIGGGGYFLVRGLVRTPDTTVPLPERTVAVATPPPAQQFLLSLDKPDLKVSPAALTYRRSASENPLLADLKPAFDAFRASDYAAADRAFSALESRYPRSVEVFFYRGISRLMLADAPGAISSLTAAEKIADSSFAWEIEWYRAVAEERAGNLAGARERLTRLCQRPDTRAPKACDAVKTLPAGK